MNATLHALQYPFAHVSVNWMSIRRVAVLDASGEARSTEGPQGQAELPSGMVQRGSPLPAGLVEGDLLAGKYRIESVIGAGAMGTVVAAHHVMLAERVAIKFLHPDRVAMHPEAKARFIREARAASRVKSEHVARVLDIAALESGDLYIVMEYLDGCDLAAWMRVEGPMPSEKAVECILQACEALAEAHALGIVHRDLKPANLYLLSRGSIARHFVKVLDFGISKTTGIVPATIDSIAEGGGADTGASALMGSPYYMSPEQMESARDVDGRTDIWALGVILFELVTGAVPFDGSNLLEVYRKMISATVPSMRKWPERAPAGLQAVVRKCIERRPDDRYSTVGELAVALMPFASPRGLASVERTLQNEKLPAPKIDSRLPASESASTTGGNKTLASRDFVLHASPPVAVLPPLRARERTKRVVLALALGAIVLAAWIAAAPFGRDERLSPTELRTTPSGAKPAESSALPAEQRSATLTSIAAAGPEAALDSSAASAAGGSIHPARPPPASPNLQAAKRMAKTPASSSETVITAPASSGTPPATSARPPASSSAASEDDRLFELLRRRE